MNPSTAAPAATGDQSGEGQQALAGLVPEIVLNRVVNAYVAVVFAAGLAATVLVTISTPHPDWVVIAGFCIVAGVAERLRVMVTTDAVAVSMSLAVILAAVVVLGPVGATLVAGSAALSVALTRNGRPPLKKTAFNFGLHTLGAAAAGLAYVAIGGDLGVHGWGVRDFASCLAALVANFAVNWPLLAIVLHLTSGKSFRQIWAEELAWTPVQILISAAIGYTLGAAYLRFGWAGAAIYIAPLLAVRESMRLYTSRVAKQMQELVAAHLEADAANQRLTAANDLLDTTNEGLLKTLASVIDARDIYLYGHSVQASKYAGQVARKMGLSDELVRVTELGALLHDIGKIGVSEAILNKPARLTDDEYSEIQSHCDIGYHLLSNLPQFEEVAEIVRSHHEHVDGTGYPRNLKGDDIHIGARIVSVVEATEAMVSDRPYRKGMSADEVLAELARCAGSQWDAQVVEAFSAILSEDHRHLVMHNSALEIALARTPVSELITPGKQGDTALASVSTTFAGASQPMFIVDEQFRVVSINPAAAHALDRKEDELQGEDWIELCGAVESDRRSPERFFGGTRVVSLPAADDTMVHFEVTSTPLRTTSASYWLLLARVMTARVGGYDRALEVGSTDFLTGLATGEELRARARETVTQGGGPTTVATLEILGLRAINETFGRATGDAAIQVTAKVLKSQVRSSDLAGRIGGGSFAVLMPSATFEDAARLLTRIEALLPGACHELDCVVEFSSGAAEWDGRETVPELIARANVWMDAHSASRDSDTVITLPGLTGLPRSASG